MWLTARAEKYMSYMSLTLKLCHIQNLKLKGSGGAAFLLVVTSFEKFLVPAFLTNH